MFLLVPAHPVSSRQRAVRRLLLLCVYGKMTYAYCTYVIGKNNMYRMYGRTLNPTNSVINKIIKNYGTGIREQMSMKRHLFPQKSACSKKTAEFQ